MATNLLLEGTDLEALLLRAHREGGTAAKIVRAEKVRRGGFLGFFAREGFEVAVEIPDGARGGDGAGDAGPTAGGEPDGGAHAATQAPVPAAPAPDDPAPAPEAPAYATSPPPAEDDADPLLGLADRASAAERAALLALATAQPHPESAPEPAPAPTPAQEPEPTPAQPRPWLPASFGADLDDHDGHDGHDGHHLHDVHPPGPDAGDLSASLLNAAPLPNVPLDLAAQVADPLLVGSGTTWAYAGAAVPAAADDAEEAPEFTALVDELRANHQGRHRLTGPRHLVEDLPREDLGSFLPPSSRGLRDDRHDDRHDDATHHAGRHQAGYPDAGSPDADHADLPDLPDLSNYPDTGPAPEQDDAGPSGDEFDGWSVTWHGDAGGAPEEDLAGYVPEPGDPEPFVADVEPAGHHPAPGFDVPPHSAGPAPAREGHHGQAAAGPVIVARATTIVPNRRPRSSFVPHPRHGEHDQAGAHAAVDEPRPEHAGGLGETADESLPGPAVEASWRLLRNLRPARRQPLQPAPGAAEDAAFSLPDVPDTGLHEPDLAPVHPLQSGFDSLLAARQETGFGTAPHAAPAGPGPAHPLDPAETARGHHRVLADRTVLEELGLPADWAARMRDGDRFAAVVGVLDRMPEPDIDPHAPVVAVVGPAAVAELEAHRTALDLPVGTRPRAVVAVPAIGAEERRSAIAAARNIRPVVIAVETDGYHDPGSARKVLRSVQADCVIAIVDATRPITETARWLEEFEHVDALAVDGALEVPDPAAVLGLDLPVVRLDGVPIDRFGWTALLCAHLVARDPGR